jgi:hypothetical protein
MIVEKHMEWRLAGETEVLGENMPQRHFCPSQNPTWPDPGLNPGRRGGKPATNRLSYGAALPDSFCGSIKVTGRGSPKGSETSRLPHFLDNRLKDGDEIVNLTRRPLFTLRKIPGTHFCYRLSRPQGRSATEMIRSIENSNRTRDLPACSLVKGKVVPVLN